MSEQRLTVSLHRALDWFEIEDKDRIYVDVKAPRNARVVHTHARPGKSTCDGPYVCVTFVGDGEPAKRTFMIALDDVYDVRYEFRGGVEISLPGLGRPLYRVFELRDCTVTARRD